MNATPTYAIGDIHGHLEKLREAHGWIAQDQRRSGAEGEVVHIGDLVDRGPDSAGVVEYLIEGIDAGQPWIVLKGNHDRMMSYYLESPSRTDSQLRAGLTWLDRRLGGMETLASYGVDIETLDGGAKLHAAATAAVPESHIGFLAQLDTVYQASDATFVHAGIRPGVKLEHQTEDDLVWIRRDFHDDKRDHGSLVVHGHTPVERVTHYGNRINIDTGVAFGGSLSAIVVEGKEVWQIGPNGRTRLEKTE